MKEEMGGRGGGIGKEGEGKREGKEGSCLVGGKG
jgi:hypothetical protein